jgi:hypothetical protein
MVNEPHALGRTSLVDGLFQSIKHEPGMRRGADTPADDSAGIGVKDEGDVDEALPGGDISEIADPEHVRRRYPELAVHLVQRTCGLLVGNGRPVRFAPDNALNAHALHQPRDRATGDIETFAPQLSPDLPHTVDPPVLLENPANLVPKRLISPSTLR